MWMISAILAYFGGAQRASHRIAFPKGDYRHFAFQFRTLITCTESHVHHHWIISLFFVSKFRPKAAFWLTQDGNENVFTRIFIKKMGPIRIENNKISPGCEKYPFVVKMSLDRFSSSGEKWSDRTKASVAKLKILNGMTLPPTLAFSRTNFLFNRI